MPFQGQWADSLLALERAFLLRVVIWGGISILIGTALVTWLSVKNLESALVRGFARHSIAWGGMAVVAAALSSRGLALRDLAGATALDRRVWFGIGLSLGCAAAGALLARVAFGFGGRFELVGAGLAMGVQGSALGLLALQFAMALVR